MAAPELGQKQICPSCQAKFYDLGKRPATCPKCGASFDPEEAVKVRRIRTRVPDYEEEERPAPVVEDAEGFEEEADETPEIDQAVEAEVVETDDEIEGDVAAPAPGAADIGVDFAEDPEVEAEADDDVPFLEDEEDEDFVEDDIEGLPEEGEER